MITSSEEDRDRSDSNEFSDDLGNESFDGHDFETQ